MKAKTLKETQLKHRLWDASINFYESMTKKEQKNITAFLLCEFMKNWSIEDKIKYINKHHPEPFEMERIEINE